jgi:glycosyltransferase involved in cell wall biosynthesis
MNESSSPSVSIGMPVYNCGRTLDAAVRSILNQTFSEWELLLVDDGSTDETLRVARGYKNPRIRVFADGLRRGLVARLNQAVSLGRGKYFARMDGDDVSYPERLALQVEFLERHSDIDLLGGGILVFGSGGGVLGTHANPNRHEDICRRPWAGFYLAHPTWMGRREWFHKNGYRSEAVRCEDQDLLLRTHRQSRFAALPEIILGYREEELSLRKNLVGRYSFARSVLRESIPERQYAVAVGVVIEQAVKGFADCVAIGTGLNYRVLRHRALPVDVAAERKWLEVWNDVQSVTAMAGPILETVGDVAGSDELGQES